MKRLSIGLALLASLFGAGCSSLSVSYNYDPQANFAAYRSFDWLPPRADGGVDELVGKNVRFAVERELAAKGVRRETRDPDLRIAIHGGRQKYVDVQEYGYAYRDAPYFVLPPGTKDGRPVLAPQTLCYERGVRTYEYEIGTLVLDFVDARRKEMVWRGVATAVVDPGSRPEDVQEAVRRLLEKYPPPAR